MTTDRTRQRRARSCLWLATLSLTAAVVVPSSAQADALQAAPDPAGIYGGSLASGCAWPSAISIYGEQTSCTASLVHPEVLVTAAHCLEGGPLHTAAFGDDAWEPAFTVGIAGCTKHPNYELDYPAYADFMVCRLAQPVTDVPIVPVLMGCDADALQPGASAVLAGYGLANDGNLEGLKRHVSTSIERLEDSRVFFVGGTGNGTCSGDSGGPSYVQLADGSWRVFGTTTGGPDCGDWGQSELIHLFVPWIEQETGIDITPCHDADGTWAPTPGCDGFPSSPADSTGSWATRCGDMLRTGPSETCGPAFGEDAEEESGDDGPTGDDGTGEVESTGDDDEAEDDNDSLGESSGEAESTTDAPPVLDGTSPFATGEADKSGCACNSNDRDPNAAAVAPLVAIVWLMRRRRPARASAPQA